LSSTAVAGDTSQDLRIELGDHLAYLAGLDRRKIGLDGKYPFAVISMCTLLKDGTSGRWHASAEHVSDRQPRTPSPRCCVNREIGDGLFCHSVQHLEF